MASARQYRRDSHTCPNCTNLLIRPKHYPSTFFTGFCEGCFTRLQPTSHSHEWKTCGVCLYYVCVSKENISNFSTNQIARSVAKDFKKRSDKKRSDKKRTTNSTVGTSSDQRCTLCDADDQGVATFYCQNCSEFLCDYCLKQHDRFKKNVFHGLVSAPDIASGKIRIHYACPEHPRELQQLVCITCLVRICCRCLEVGHEHDRHEVIGIEEYEEGHKAAVHILQKKIEHKSAVIQSHSLFVKEQIVMVQNIIGQRRQEIKNVFEGAVERIRERKDQLLNECNTYQRSLCEDLKGIIQCHNDFLNNLSAKVSVVTEESAQRSDQSLPERVARVGELEALMKGDNPDTSLPESIALRAEFLTFHQAAESKGLDIGTVQVKGRRELRETASFDGGVTCLAATPDRHLAFTTRNGDTRENASGPWQLMCDLSYFLVGILFLIGILYWSYYLLF